MTRKVIWNSREVTERLLRLSHFLSSSILYEEEKLESNTLWCAGGDLLSECWKI